MADWRTALAGYAARFGAIEFVPTTLCDMCGKACGHCRWSRKGVQKPVEGWDAIRRDIPVDTEGKREWLESYVVLDCPEFQMESRCWAYYGMFDKESVRTQVLQQIETGGGWDEA